MKSVIVWDIETVPDLEGYARVHKLEGKTDEEIRAAMGSKVTARLIPHRDGAVIIPDA